MLEKGNGDVAVCATNLVRTIRHTVPFERFKGISIDVLDKPITEKYLIQAEVDSVLSDYEPRMSSRDVTVVANDPANGGVTLDIKAS